MLPPVSRFPAAGTLEGNSAHCATSTFQVLRTVWHGSSRRSLARCRCGTDTGACRMANPGRAVSWQCKRCCSQWICWWRICQWLSPRGRSRRCSADQAWNGHRPQVHRCNVNCELLMDLTLANRRLFTETEEDGWNEAIQEQVMGHDMQTILTNCKHTIRRRLADMTKDPRVRVMIQSHCGKHRSMAMAEFLMYGFCAGQTLAHGSSSLGQKLCGSTSR